MIHYSLNKIANITGGTVVGNKDVVINGIDIDSRTISNDSLFVPIVGAKFDGHSFVKDLFNKGLYASLWQKGNDNEMPVGNIVVVDNIMQALFDLTAYYRKELNTIIIGVTGSSGKTSTKDIIYSVLAHKYPTFKTLGNQNNEIGIPLTILNCQDNCKYGVVEIGISDFNEMEPMARLARPDYTVITSIGPAHIGQFKSIDNIVIEKSKINSYLTDGICFYNAESQGLKQHLNTLKLQNKPIGYGYDNGDVIANNIVFSVKGTNFKCLNEEYFIPILGKHFVLNALSAILLAKHFKFNYQEIQDGLASIHITNHRMQLIKIKNAIVIDDAYNANPSSMIASLNTMCQYQCDNEKIVVLGDMLELGEDSSKLHGNISNEIDFKKFDKIYLVGQQMLYLADQLKKKDITSIHVDKAEQLIDCLKPYLEKENVILFKASNGMKFIDLIDKLKEDA